MEKTTTTARYQHLFKYIEELESLVQRSYNLLCYDDAPPITALRNLKHDLQDCVIKNNLHR